MRMYWATFLALPSSLNGALMPEGRQEAHLARRVLDKFGVGMPEQTFVAAPATVSMAVIETQGIVLDWPINNFSEPGRIVFPLKPTEGSQLERLVTEVDMSGGLADLGVGSDVRHFVANYGAERYNQYKECGGYVRHSLTIGYPLLLQAIALAFPLDAENRARLERMAIHPGTIFQIDCREGQIRTEEDVETDRFVLPAKKGEAFTSWPKG